MKEFTHKELRYWIDRIEERARGFGLDFYPQEFNIVSQERSTELLASTGIVDRYTHWSTGKAYDRFETLYKYGVISHLPYELVINSNPCQAYLLEGNSPIIQILVIAHVYAHNDFFKNNFLFSATNPEEVLDLFSDHADHIDRLIRRVGTAKVETALTAAHALRNQRLSLPGSVGHQNGLNLLRYILEVCPRLARWEKDILKIVDEEWEYFVPQVETKIMNEGWAAYWHTQIVKSLDLPPELMTDFIVENSKVVFGIPQGGINPYNIGINMFSDIKETWDRLSRGELRRGETWDGLDGTSKIFDIRTSNKDNTFIESYLSIEAAHASHLVKYDESDEREVVAVSDEEGFEEVKEAFSRQVGSRIFPVVRAVEASGDRKRQLWLKHEFDGRNLDEEYLRKTLEHAYVFWKEPIYLETRNDIPVVEPYGTSKELPEAPYCYVFDGKKHDHFPIQFSRDSSTDEDMKILADFIRRLTHS